MIYLVEGDEEYTLQQDQYHIQGVTDGKDHSSTITDVSYNT